MTTDGPFLPPFDEEWLEHLDEADRELYARAAAAAAQRQREVSRDFPLLPEASGSAVLLALLARFHGIGPLHWGETNPQVVMLGWGWWVRCNRLGDAVRALSDAGLAADSVPLIRSMAEHAVMLNALAHEPGHVLPVVLAEHDRFLANMHRETAGTVLEQPQEVQDLGRASTGPAPDPDMQYVKKMQQLFSKYDPLLYSQYRVWSAEVHPTAAGAGSYVEFVPGGPVRLSPREIRAGTGGRMVEAATALWWAHHALTQILPGEPGLDELLALGEPIGARPLTRRS